MNIGLAVRTFKYSYSSVTTDSCTSQMSLFIDVSDELLYFTEKCWSNEVNAANITELVVGDGKCNDITSLDLSSYTELRSIEIGNECFENVNELHIEGLPKLEIVTIGINSFTKYKNSYDWHNYRYFYLRNCPLLKELRIGRYSFSDYGFLYVENLESLEYFECGDVNENSYNFYYAHSASFLSD